MFKMCIQYDEMLTVRDIANVGTKQFVEDLLQPVARAKAAGEGENIGNH